MSLLSPPQPDTGPAADSLAEAGDPPGPAGPEGGRLPGLRDRGIQVLLAATFLVELGVWFAIEGYQLADTVEYVKLANDLFDSGRWPATAVSQRPPAFPLLLLPIFHVLDWLGVDDLRPVMIVARVLQLVISLVFVLVTVRMGTLLAGRRAGYLAGFLVVFNPMFLRHCLDPMSDPSAAILIALGIERLLQRRSVGRTLVGGILLGLAFLLSYKTLPIVAVLFVCFLIRDRWVRRSSWISIGAGFCLSGGIGVGLDRIVYGGWGWGLRNYMIYHFGTVLVQLLNALGLDGAALWAFKLCGEYYSYQTTFQSQDLTQRIAVHTPPSWYLEHMPDFLVWPVLVLSLLGLWRCLRRPRASTSIVLATVLAYLAVLSFKHSKEFRLLMVVLPLMAPICAIGWLVLWGRPGQRLAGGRRLLAGLALVLAVLLGVRSFLQAKPRLHGHYWRAMAWIEEHLDSRPGRAHFAAGREFAILYRYSPRLYRVSLPRSLEAWPTPAEGVALAQAGHRALSALHWLVVPEHILFSNPVLLRSVNRLFSLEAAFLRGGNDLGTGPVYVLRRRDQAGEGRRFSHFVRDGDPDRWRARQGLGARFSFARPGPDPDPEVLDLLGLGYETIPGDDLGFMVWHWTTPTGFGSNCMFRVCAFSPSSQEVYHLRIAPVHGLRSVPSWAPGEIAVERRWVGLSAQGLLNRGGSARVWLSAEELGPASETLGHLVPTPGPSEQSPSDFLGDLPVVVGRIGTPPGEDPP